MNIDFNRIIQEKLTQMEDEGVIQKKIEATLEKSIMDAIESELGSYSFRNALGKHLEDGVSMVAKDCGLSAYNSFLAAKVKDIISGIASDDLGKKIETAVSGVLVQRYDGIKLSDIFKRYRENVMESASDSEKDDRQEFTMKLDAHEGYSGNFIVEPVRRGNWNIRCSDERTLCLECSECGRKVDNINLHRLLIFGAYGEACRMYPYCHCGAKMDLEDGTDDN